MFSGGSSSPNSDCSQMFSVPIRGLARKIHEIVVRMPGRISRSTIISVMNPRSGVLVRSTIQAR